MNKGTTIFIDTEDMEERYGEELYKEYLEKENKQLKEENEKLNHYKLLYQKVKERNDLGIERLEALILFWKKYNPVDNHMQVEQFKGVIDILRGENNE